MALCIVNRAAAWAVPANSNTPIPWDTVVYDPAGMLNVNTTQIDILTTGFYQISYTCSIPIGLAIMFIRLNGSTQISMNTNYGGNKGTSLITRQFTQGDFIEFVFTNNKLQPVDIQITPDIQPMLTVLEIPDV